VKLFLFLDDWFLDSRIDIVRRFGTPIPVPIPDACALARSYVVYDEGKGDFRALVNAEKKGLLYASADGIEWEKTGRAVEFPLVDAAGKEDPTAKGFPGQSWFYDKWDEDPGRRYKMIVWPNPTGGPGIITCSPDGVEWERTREYTWYDYPRASDTDNNIFYNPFTRRWCVICRKSHLDRRASMVESTDLEDWTEPRVIVHPDALDDPLLQFYGMVATLYEDEYFIGALQCFRVPSQEVNPEYAGRVKMEGTVDVQLVYSYDGQSWLRSDRSTMIARTEPGSYGCSCVYPRSIVQGPDGKVHVYSLGALQDHSVDAVAPEGYESGEALLLHTFRKDGFAYLEPTGGWGHFITRTLVPDSGRLTVNYQAPLGQVLVQVSGSDGKPVPGYGFGDCVALRGDEVYGPVHWKEHEDLSALIGKPVRLEFRLFDARVYAIRVECALKYHYYPEQVTERV
jgi:hypothetical protein